MLASIFLLVLAALPFSVVAESKITCGTKADGESETAFQIKKDRGTWPRSEYLRMKFELTQKCKLKSGQLGHSGIFWYTKEYQFEQVSVLEGRTTGEKTAHASCIEKAFKKVIGQTVDCIKAEKGSRADKGLTDSRTT